MAGTVCCVPDPLSLRRLCRSRRLALDSSLSRMMNRCNRVNTMMIAKSTKAMAEPTPHEWSLKPLVYER